MIGGGDRRRGNPLGGWAIGTFVAHEWGDEIGQTAGDVTESVSQTSVMSPRSSIHSIREAHRE